MSVDFKAQLFKQLGFLWRSCAAYDQGHLDEAVRIATVIRVLVHDTSKSTSLLNHLCALNINLASTVSNLDHSKSVFLTGMGRLTMTNTKSTWAPAIDCSAIDKQISVPDWWSQVVYVLGKVQATRKSLVLAAANKDGGTHVDSSLTHEYETLMHTGELGWFRYRPQGIEGSFQPVMDTHLIYIRQMGFELLNSPELLALASNS
ncbi:MAG TPA: hypothetical protein VIJ79_12520 [Acidobacteriaceae bacterium]